MGPRKREPGSRGPKWRAFTAVRHAGGRNFGVQYLRGGNRFIRCGLVPMLTFETTDPKVARRCRYDQHRRQKTTLTIEGSLVTGLVHSVMEAKSGNPRRWIITVIAKPSIAA